MLRPSSAHPGLDIKLSGTNEWPQDARVTFTSRAQAPLPLSPVRRRDRGRHRRRGFRHPGYGIGTALTFENARIAIASFEPAKALGPSAFGPLRYRLLSADADGDWRALATLVRVPVLQGLECPQAADAPCVLTGTNLFLLDSVAADAQFAQAVHVPEGFPGQSLQVPRPVSSQLYLRLRDDPQVTSVAEIR